jgi:hypothetical protein
MFKKQIIQKGSTTKAKDFSLKNREKKFQGKSIKIQLKENVVIFTTL